MMNFYIIFGSPSYLVTYIDTDGKKRTVVQIARNAEAAKAMVAMLPDCREVLTARKVDAAKDGKRC